MANGPFDTTQGRQSPRKSPGLNAEGILGAVFVVLCLFAFWKLFARASLEFQGSEYSDVAIFATVARGWLNGYRPYIDLFENKAPGIYMTIAASWELFGDRRLLWWMQGLVTMTFPFLLAVSSWFAFGTRLPAGQAGNSELGSKKSRLVATAIAFLFGSLLSLYVSIKGGPVFIESYAAFAGAAFVGFLATRTFPLRLTDQLLLVVPLGIALGFKEPMFFSIMGGALIILPSFRSALGLLVPIGIVTVLGIIALHAFGFLPGYTGVYLPHIINHHLFHPWGTVDEPMWLRVIDLPRMWKNLATVSVFLPWVVGMVWVGSLILLLLRVIFFSAPHPPASSPAGRGGVILSRWLLATLLTALPVGLTGDFYFHHFVFAVPGYCGFFLVCVREWNSSIHPGIQRGALAAFVALTVAGLPSVSTPFGARDEDFRQWEAPRIRAAAALDTVMDRCGIDRYFVDIDRPEGVYGFTRHSPYGPIFTQYGRFIGVRTQYLDAFMRTLETAKILITRSDDEVVQVDPATRAFITQSFTEKPWPCARDFVQPTPYRILFRIGAR